MGSGGNARQLTHQLILRLLCQRSDVLRFTDAVGIDSFPKNSAEDRDQSILSVFACGSLRGKQAPLATYGN
jgi:hypothetical protein